jgi:hypothetical protein
VIQGTRSSQIKRGKATSSQDIDNLDNGITVVQRGAKV